MGKYGYLQIDGYAAKQKLKSKGFIPGPKQWIPLPEGAQVHTSRCWNRMDDMPKKLVAEPRRSCLRWGNDDAECGGSPRSLLSGSSTSTAASTSDRQRVSFSDGTLPGSETSCDSAKAMRSNPSLDEWIYIDRDICGFSLYEY